MNAKPAFKIGLLCLTLLVACTPSGFNSAAVSGDIDSSTQTTLTLPDSGIYHGTVRGGRLHGQGWIQWRDGTRYEGGFVDGLMEGQGYLQRANGDLYRGHFKAGLRHGAGTLLDGDGSSYVGEFIADRFHGLGVFQFNDGNVYSGHFEKGRFNGQGIFWTVEGREYEGEFRLGDFDGKGVIRYPDKHRYEGSVLKWMPEGEGTLVLPHGAFYEGQFQRERFSGQGTFHDANGDVYRGQFKNGMFHGKGRLDYAEGGWYEGEWQNGQFNGKGLRVYSNGDRFEGEFAFGTEHGKGTYRPADAAGNKRSVTGTWEYGKFVQSEQTLPEKKKVRRRLDGEALLYAQPQRLSHALKSLRPQRANVRDIYFVAFAAFGEQDVFMLESLYAKNLFESRYDAKGHTIALINNQNKSDAYPLATVTNLKRTLARIGSMMNTEEDLLFLYITSHGSRDGLVSVRLGEITLNDLTTENLAEAINQSGIKWRILAISACYSGAFIEMLRGPTTLVMTSASPEKTSFGCGDEEEFTFFGRALFQRGLHETTSFEEAFHIAQRLVSGWETDKDYDPSQPQIDVGSQIAEYLARGRK